MQLKEFHSFRKELHKYPELSGKEVETAEKIRKKLEQLQPTAIHTGIGGHGILADYSFATEGPTLLFRADIDAVAVQEIPKRDYSSSHPGIAHQCGHDGHTAILLAFADLLHRQPLKRGRILLLFQPSEENGQGAAQAMAHPFFSQITIDQAYALHNLPGFPLSAVVCRPGSFTCSVISCTIYATGKTSHAAEPEKAVSPASSLIEILNTATSWNTASPETDEYFRTTLIELHIGEEAYGVTAGSGLLRLTLRAATAHNLDTHTEKIEQLIQELQASHPGLHFSIEWLESFTANQNSPDAVENVRNAAHALKLPYIETPNPFTWGEDFGLITQHIPGAMFGLGAGTDTPPLHTPEYDFPNEIILHGAQMFHQIAEKATLFPMP